MSILRMMCSVSLPPTIMTKSAGMIAAVAVLIPSPVNADKDTEGNYHLKLCPTKSLEKVTPLFARFAFDLRAGTDRGREFVEPFVRTTRVDD